MFTQIQTQIFPSPETCAGSLLMASKCSHLHNSYPQNLDMLLRAPLSCHWLDLTEYLPYTIGAALFVKPPILHMIYFPYFLFFAAHRNIEKAIYVHLYLKPSIAVARQNQLLWTLFLSAF